jgi:hypothetical protein
VEVTGASQACAPAGNAAPQVVVSPGGAVHVAYLHFGSGPTGEEIAASRSTDGGATFGAPVKVADAHPTGSLGFVGLLQGAIAGNEHPTLAVDRSGGARNGHLYVAWSDGVEYAPVDVQGYAYADVLFSRSTDAGASWSAPARVNTSVEPQATGVRTDRGYDQWNPAMAVDRMGAVGVCFYDRRGDKANFLFDRYCARSVNGGATWSNVKKTAKSLKPVPGQDALLVDGDGFSDFMGDYDGLAADFLKLAPGFRGAYGDTSLGNLDARTNSF